MLKHPANAATQATPPRRAIHHLPPRRPGATLAVGGRARRRPHARPLHRNCDHLVRPRVDPDQALHDERDRQRHPLQHAARQGRRAAQAAVRLHEVRRGRRPRAHGQGLRARQGPVRGAHLRRAEGARRRRDADHRAGGVRPRERGRSAATSRRATTSGPTRAASAPTSCSATRCWRPGLVGIASYSARGKQYIVALRPVPRGPDPAPAALRGRGQGRGPRSRCPRCPSPRTPSWPWRRC